MAKRIALVGGAITTRHLAPWDDPAWEIWGLGLSISYMKRADRLFELHQRHDLLLDIRGQLDLFLATPVRLGARRFTVHPELLTLADGGPTMWDAFPFAEIEAGGRSSYFTSSIAWLIAYLLMTEPDCSTIGLWGVHLTRWNALTAVPDGRTALVLDSLENGLERSCIEHWLGIAKGRGIEVVLPPGCPLLRGPYRYGIESSANAAARIALTERRDELVLCLEESERDAAFADRAVGQILARLDEREHDDENGERVSMLRTEMSRAQSLATEARGKAAETRTRLSEICLRTVVDTIADDHEMAEEV